MLDVMTNWSVKKKSFCGCSSFRNLIYV